MYADGRRGSRCPRTYRDATWSMYVFRWLLKTFLLYGRRLRGLIKIASVGRAPAASRLLIRASSR